MSDSPRDPGVLDGVMVRQSSSERLHMLMRQLLFVLVNLGHAIFMVFRHRVQEGLVPRVQVTPFDQLHHLIKKVLVRHVFVVPTILASSQQHQQRHPARLQYRLHVALQQPSHRPLPHSRYPPSLLEQ